MARTKTQQTESSMTELLLGGADVLVAGPTVVVANVLSGKVHSTFHAPGETFCARWNHNCTH
jgi:hypothetical protein